MLKRRSVLKMFGAVAAAPETVANHAWQMTRTSSKGLGSQVIWPAATVSKTDPANALTFANFVLANGIPDAIKEVLENAGDPVYGLDADIAAYRSFSMAAKVTLQRERNKSQQHKKFLRAQKNTITMAAVKSMFGVDIRI